MQDACAAVLAVVSGESLKDVRQDACSCCPHQDEQPYSLKLTSTNGDDTSVIAVNARFVPVDIVLEPRETINSGWLAVTHPIMYLS
jgi:hypothetical protein